MTDSLFYITTMPSSRQADYHLGYMDGCVFLDFDNAGEDLIRLKRISFDGYGCCDLEDQPVPLNADESKAFKCIIQNNINDQDRMLILVKKAVSLNKNLIWLDALSKYHLV